ncbi:MAG: hypothetical protein AAGJ10_15255, partial [Bacteroidota bacterium]
IPLFARNGSVYAPQVMVPYVDLGTDQKILVRTEHIAHDGVEAVAVNRLHIYTPISGSMQYMHLVYERYVNAATRADTWTWRGMWVATRTGYRAFVDVELVAVDWTELDFAVKETGKPDFSGGVAHGYQELFAPLIALVDGALVNVFSTQTWYECETFAMVDKTNILEQGNAAGVVRAVLRSMIDVAPGRVDFRNRLVHSGTWTINGLYLGMIAQDRVNDNGAVVSRMIDDQNYADTDVSDAGAQIILDGAEQISLISDRLGLNVTMRVSDVSNPQLARHALAQRVAEHTKVYIGMVGVDTIVYASQPLEWKAQWEFNKLN